MIQTGYFLLFVLLMRVVVKFKLKRGSLSHCLNVTGDFTFRGLMSLIMEGILLIYYAKEHQYQFGIIESKTLKKANLVRYSRCSKTQF